MQMSPKSLSGDGILPILDLKSNLRPEALIWLVESFPTLVKLYQDSSLGEEYHFRKMLKGLLSGLERKDQSAILTFLRKPEWGLATGNDLLENLWNRHGQQGRNLLTYLNKTSKKEWVGALAESRSLIPETGPLLDFLKNNVQYQNPQEVLNYKRSLHALHRLSLPREAPLLLEKQTALLSDFFYPKSPTWPPSTKNQTQFLP